MCETPLYFKTITEISEDIASKQLSPVDVTAGQINTGERHTECAYYF